MELWLRQTIDLPRDNVIVSHFLSRRWDRSALARCSSNTFPEARFRLGEHEEVAMPVRGRNAGDRRGRSRLGVMAALVLALTISGCSSSPEKTAPSETLRIGVLQAVDYLPYFVMVDKGFAAQEGLRFEETVFPGGAAILAALNDGTVDLGEIGIPPLVSGARKGVVPAKAVVVASGVFVTPAAPQFGVVVSSEVRGWGDLSGRRVLVNARDSIGGASLPARLVHERVAAAELVEVPFPNMGLALRSGDVVAAVMIEPYLTQSLLRGDGHLLGWVVGGVPVERAQTAAWTIRTELTKIRPGAVKAFLRAYLDAVAWMKTNESEAREVLARHLSLSPEVTRKLRLPLWNADGRNDPAQMGVIVDLNNKVQAGRPVAPRDLYDEDLLGAVLKER